MVAQDVSALVTSAARATPGRTAVVEAGGRTLTWRELDDEVSRVAVGLGARGVVAGHRVLLLVDNRVELVAGYLGVLRAQAVAVPLDPATPADRLARVLDDVAPRLVVAEPDAARRVRAAVAATDAGRGPVVVTVGLDGEDGEDGDTYADLTAGTGSTPPALRDPERLAALLHTETPAGPRAAMLSHRALAANVEQVAAVAPPMVDGDDVVLAVVPLWHVYGLSAVLGSVLRQRARLVVARGFDPDAVLDLVAEHGCTVVPVAPPAFAAWRGTDRVAERLGSVRLVLSGSALLAGDEERAFTERTGVPVAQGYGLTEAAPVVTSTLCSRRPDGPAVAGAPTTLGAPLPGVALRVAGEPDGPGEVEVRGDNLFSGYWPDGADGPGPDGWWATGDVGYLDDHGDLVLVDPVEDVVPVAGFSVYPSEVEAVLRTVDGVASAAVVADGDDGLLAHVVLAGGADPDAVLAAIDRRGRERLAGFKRPGRVEVVDVLPRNAAGRVSRAALRRRGPGLLGEGA